MDGEHITRMGAEWDKANLGQPLVVGDAEGNVRPVALGAANTVLASNGAEAAPSFKTVPAALGGAKKVTGSKGANAALTSLCEQLAALGLIVNETT